MRKANGLPREVLNPHLVELATEPMRLVWSAIFGNTQPVELEIGFGKGLFLVVAAQANPGINYVGVEIDRGLQLYAANRIAKRGLGNVRLVKADARLFLRDWVAADSVQAVHVYFPDPWWKRRHKKRRIFTGEFAASCERVLTPGGRLRIATDVEEYFQVMTRLVGEETPLLRAEDARRSVSEERADYLTNFERKARQQGRQVWQATYVKAVGE